MASREWVSSASASASRPPRKGPGIVARRALPGLFLCAGLLLCLLPADTGSRHALLGVTPAGAAAWQGAPDPGTPPGNPGGDEGDEGEEADSVSVLPDSTLFMPADIGVKPVRTDTTGVKSHAVGLPQSNLPPPGVYGPPVPGGPGSVPAKPARKGVFGLHPAVILLGLVVAHVAIIKLVTH